MTCSPRWRGWPVRALLASVLVSSAVLALAPVTSASPSSQSCPIAALPGLSQVAGANLGCATSEPFTTTAVDQQFEHGRMVWVEEWGSVSVLHLDATYDAYNDYFDPEIAEPAPLSPPSPALLEPRTGFGKVWRALGGPAAPTGWATDLEASYPATMQYFQRGAAIQRPDSTAYALLTHNQKRGTWLLVDD